MVNGVFGIPDASAAFRNFIEDPQAQLDEFANDPQVQREIDYFISNIGDLETIDDLFDNRRLTQFVLSAFSLEGEIDALGRIRAVVEADFTDPTSLPNVLADPRFRELAAGLRLDRDGVETFQNADLVADLTQRFIRNEFEVRAGEQDSALREAIFFSRNISNSNDVFDILGDGVLRSVVQGALQIPQELAIQPVLTQARAIESRIDIENLITLSNELGVNETQIQRARTDASILENNLTVSDAALNQVTTLSDQLQLVINAYGELTNITDPVNGPYAADIPIQEVAVPELIRFEQLLSAGETGLNTVQSNLTQLENIIAQAQDPSADLATLQTQFSALVSTINTRIADTEITNPFGVTENILTNGANDTISVTLDANGRTATINRFDISDLQASLATADAAFSAATSSTDSNITTALGRVLIAGDRATAIQETIAIDLEGFTTSIGEVEAFAATLSTNQLIQGAQSAQDSLNRLDTIDSLLDQIRDIADESVARLPGDDRSDLDVQFIDLRQQLRDAVENAGNIGFDNFLNNIGDQQYEIINGANITIRGGIDLATTISDILDTEDITTRAGAESLSTSAILGGIRTDEARDNLQADLEPLNSVLSRYDPRGVIDNAILTIQSQLSNTIAGADVNGVNLLSATQNDITLEVGSSFSALGLSAFNNFGTDVAAGLNNAISFLQTDTNQVISELQDLKDFTVDSVRRGLTSDANQLNLEFARNGAVLDAVEAQEESLEENPYQVNSFTLRFIERFLILNGGQGGTDPNGQNPDAFLVNLVQPLNVNGQQGQQNQDPFASLFNLIA